MSSCLLALSLAPFAQAQGVGAKYGTRDPAVCKSTKEPEKGAPTAEQVAQYVRCGYEREDTRNDNLWLKENLKAEIGKGRPYTSDLINMSDADTTQPVYPIRGSFVQYMCRITKYAPGKNCSMWESPAATGLCYRTTFGDWKCGMQDLNSKVSHNQPPPAGK
jgi:hypothetical protein